MAGQGGLWPGKLVRITGASKSSFRCVDVRFAPDADEYRERIQAGQAYSSSMLDEQPGQILDANGEDEVVVRTFDGQVTSVPTKNLQDYTPPAAEDGGFDLAWPAEEEAGLAFGGDVSQALLKKGYCVVQMFMSEEQFTEALEASNKAGEVYEFKSELEADFLGRDNYTKAKKLRPDDLDIAPADALDQCERQLSQIGMMVGPLTPSLFDFETVGRSASFARMRYANKAEAEKLKPVPLEQDDADDGVISDHIRFVQSRKISMLYLINSEGGELVLYPKDGKQVLLPLGKSRVVIFRHDQMAYAYKPLGNAFALQSWILREVPGFQVDTISGPLSENARVMDVNGPQVQEGRKMNIMAMQCRFPGIASDENCYWLMTSVCTDCCTEWPFVRFDKDLYYTTDPSAALMGKSYTNHGGHITYEELTFFSNDFFGISDAEAFSMSWNQRMTAEVAYDAFFKAGWRRQDMKGKHIGMYIGDVGSDWHSMTPFASMMAYNPDLTATAVHSALVPARLAHCFNFIGPTMTFDTACSASLVATHHAHVNMINFHLWGKECHGSLCGGVNSLAPSGFIGNCAANMLSHIGRSFTYDRTADGYQRGEGCGMMYTRLTDSYADTTERLACIAGSCANQDGRSASLTAPNGPSQQAVLRHSLRFANIDPDQVTCVECHGTGTALGDPIEVGAIMAVMDGERDDPLPHTSAKSNIAHLESAAGIAGVLKCLIILLHSSATPNVHLRALNPHLESAGFPQLFELEMVHTMLNSGYAGVSSFGFGGTNSRGDLYARAISGPSAKTTMVRERIDIIAVTCPRCLGDMCARCGAAIPSNCGKIKHQCELVRDEFADYEYCSHCYQGDFRFGGVIEDMAKWQPSYEVYITGTWNNFTELDQMEMLEDGTYACAVALGHTRCERFQLAVFENMSNALYPASENADSSIRIEGPDDRGRNKHWLIDGRPEQAPEGTVYQITFHWGDERKQIKWERLDDEIPALVIGREWEHCYFIAGSWNSWGVQQMRRRRGDEEVYEFSFEIGRTGVEEFQFVRDKDWNQAIYPAELRAEASSIPVRGPDGRGSGKNFLIRGKKKELVDVKLCVTDGQITVSVSSASIEKAWANNLDEPYDMFYVAGEFNNWTCSMMTPDPKKPGVYRYRLIMQDSVDHFQIVGNLDWKQTLHPATPDAICGQDLVKGPDTEGDGLNWLVMGAPGAAVDIVVDLHHEDKRRIVSWSLASDAMLADA